MHGLREDLSGVADFGFEITKESSMSTNQVRVCEVEARCILIVEQEGTMHLLPVNVVCGDDEFSFQMHLDAVRAGPASMATRRPT